MKGRPHLQPGRQQLKIKCYKGRCRHNLQGECTRPLVTIDELGMCTDAHETSQYPQEILRSKGRPKRPAQPNRKGGGDPGS